MKPIRVYPLWMLPLLVLLLFSVLLSLITVHEYRELEENITSQGASIVRQDMARLQRIFQESLASRKFLLGERELTALGVKPEVNALVALDPAGHIMASTRFAWKGRPAPSVVPAFDPARFGRLRNTRRMDVTASHDGRSILAYYPLTLPPQAGDLRADSVGGLFMEYDLGHRLTAARTHVLMDSGLAWLLGLLVMGVMLVTMHAVAIRPVRRLSDVARAVAGGEPGAHVDFVGRGVMAELGSAFNEMSSEVKNNLSQLKHQRRIIERTAAEERVLGTLLRLSLQGLTVQEFTKQSLELLTSDVSWLGLTRKGAVFLMDGDGDEGMLRLAAAVNFSEAHKAQCTQVPVGRCLCGRAASTAALQFSSHIDERHEIRYEGMTPHGHYCVPIRSEERNLGVLTLYVVDGHQPDDQEEDFLRRVADVLSMGISRVQAAQQIEHQAYHDPLTGLPNRHMLFDRLQATLAIEARLGVRGALMFLDLDNFKTLNDALGHSTGDDLLNKVAQRLTKLLRPEDTVARLGGDEFVVLLPELSPDRDTAVYHASIVARKILDATNGPYILGEYEHHLNASMGIAMVPEHGQDPEDVLKHADAAMYRAKSDGGGIFRFYHPDMQAAVDERLGLEKQLRIGLTQRQFKLHYQPQLDSDGRIIGAEALIRWEHPDHGIIPPTRFIGIAESSGLIVPLGEWVLRQACTQIRQWSVLMAFEPDWYIAVNLSPHQFRHSNIVMLVRTILAETGAEAAHLMLELTERVVIDNVEATIEKMNELKALGVRFSLDDFGTGYSSLAYLKRLPVDQVKIDRSFIGDLSDQRGDAAIVETIIDMAGHMRMDVVAEGVETARQLRCLTTRGCRKFQGYYFTPALEVAAFERYVLDPADSGAATPSGG